MSSDMPATLAYEFVTAHLVVENLDSADVDRYPDGGVFTGTVAIKAVSRDLLEVGAAPPTTVFRYRPARICQVDSDGFLLGDDGGRGLNLIRGVYEVEYRLQGVTSNPFLVDLPGGGTTDLTTVTPEETLNGLIIAGGVTAVQLAAAIAAALASLALVDGGTL